jgi:glucose/arabinose dehydrogenase/mono/diheme cytochrome c family protein
MRGFKLHLLLIFYTSTMKTRLLIISTILLISAYFNSCNSNSSDDKTLISADSSTIAAGEASFNRNCSGCHNFRQDGIGPQLSGLTTEVSLDWIRHFIKNPKQIITSGDERAQQLFKKFKAVMPSFDSMKDDTLSAVLAFMNTHKFSPKEASKKYGGEITNPVPSPIQLSSLVGNVQLVTQIPRSSDSSEPLPRTRITKLSFQPNTDNIFILDLQSRLYKLQNGRPIIYMDIAKLKPKFINKPGLATGFGSFAFHPDFAKNGLLYTTHTEAPGSAKADFGYADSIKVTVQWVLTEWKVNNPADSVFAGAGREILRVNMVTGIHGVQEITFNPISKRGDEDYGLLYVGVGDGGAVENGYPFLAHSTEKIWGTVLRIDPTGRNSSNGQYGIPTTNPFVQNSDNKTLKEIYAYGFRNPHRITWSMAGDMFVCNIGQANAESINLVKPGHDYGWPIREGTYLLDPYGDLTRVYPLPANDSIYKITYPVAYFDHDEGLAITGGFEYSGKMIPELTGKFLFGVIGTGRLLYINMADIKQGKQALIKEWRIIINGKPGTLKELSGAHERVDLRFGRDSHGELYLLTKVDGKVYKLVSATTKS